MVNPFLLVGIADTRLSATARTNIAEAFFVEPLCCLRPGMARDLRERLVDAAALLTDIWCIVLYFFAVLVSMVVVDIEWRHGRNRARSNKHGQTCLAQFTAKYIGTSDRINWQPYGQEVPRG